MELYNLSGIELADKIKSKEVAVSEVVESSLNRIAKLDSSYNAFITICGDKALAKAKEIQERINSGEVRSPLAGIPIAIKDNISTKGVLTTCASKILGNFVPPYNATIIDKLNNAGAIMVGKVNMDEFAMGSTTETSYIGITKNPWNTDHVPGGSSGGAAAAVAAREVSLAIGSDTGGSIRQPSGYCGVTGMKPSYGTVSRYGLLAYGSSLDQMGPIATNARDCAALFDIIKGYDQRDTTSVNLDFVSSLSGIDNDIKGKKIGIPTEYFGDGLDAEVRTAVMNAAKTLTEMGAIVEEFSLSMVEYAVPAYYIIASAEASSNLSRYDGIKYGYRGESKSLREVYLNSRSEGFGMEVKRRIMLGAFALSSGYYDAYYNKALQVKAMIKSAFDDAFDKYDAILSPIAPTTAPKIGESLSDPLKMYLSDIYTVSVNLAGLPGISLPCGYDSKGLPIGLQLIGQRFTEDKLLNIANKYQSVTDYHKAIPTSCNKEVE